MKIGTNGGQSSVTDLHGWRDKRVQPGIKLFEFVEVTELFGEMRYGVGSDVQLFHLSHVTD